MHSATLLMLVLATGLASQWLAWRIRLPAIVILIAAGVLLGPVSGLVTFSMPSDQMAELIGMGVAIILFEGGMDLRLGEFRRVGHGIGRLTLLGPPVAWILGSLAAHYIAGLSWPVASVLGAILIVTGPTVVLPLLSQARLNKESASLLKWEGIVNDPIGVMVAVLAFQYFTSTEAELGSILISSLGAGVVGALVFGGAGGWLVSWVYRRGWVPEHLKAPVLMVLVLLVYWLSNQVQHEAGLMSVTIMGLVVGNMQLTEREVLYRFKQHLTIVLLSVLFIIIPSQLSVQHLELIDWRILLFVLAILLLVRPASIALATLGSPMRKQDKWLLAWIAPRGIVAAATAGVFGPALVAAGYADAAKLLPIIFLVIIVTVLAHGLTIDRVARRLGLSAAKENGLLIVGSNPFSIALASALKKLNIAVLIIDGAYRKLNDARMEGINVYYGELLSERAEETLETHHLSYMLCATSNDFYNALVCKAEGRRFGYHRTFQLAILQESKQTAMRMTVQQRGRIAFDDKADYETLLQRLAEGWKVQSTKLSANHGLAQMKQRLGVQGQDWFLLGGITPKGELRLYATVDGFSPAEGWTLLVLAPPKRAAESNLGGSE